MMAYGINYPNPSFPQMGMGYGVQAPQFVPQYPQQGNPQYPQQGNDSGIIWVSGEAGMKSYLVQPNKTVQLWDSEAPIIYLKSADASGMPSVKILDYTIREQNQSNNKSEYVTKSDLEALEERIMKQLNNNGNYKRRHENSKDEERDRTNG